MEGIPLLGEIVTIFALSVVVVYICQLIRIPTIVGLLITGLIAGPYGFAFVSAVHEVEVMAEVGIMLLLFTIGLEFSIKQLIKIKKIVLIGGGLQVIITGFTAYFFTQYLDFSYGESVFWGFLIALSSTAIVLNQIQDRGEIDTPQGRNMLGILIFQDVIIVPMMLVVPFLAGGDNEMTETVWGLLLKAGLIVLFVIVSAYYIVPVILHQIAKTRNRELFILSIVVIAFAVAWLTSSLGLSLSLGAFLAGLIISESEYSHAAVGNIIPFKDVFTSLFFVSIGMLLNLDYFFGNILLIVATGTVVIIVKAIIAGAVVGLLGFPLRIMIIAGLGLSQVGEFSFILSKVGIEYGLISGDAYQLFLSFSVLTMAVTPFIINGSTAIAKFALKLPVPHGLRKGWQKREPDEFRGKQDHLIIIGFGLNGSNLARAAKLGGIPYVAVEMNPDTVREEKKKGEPIFFGDASHTEILNHAKIGTARIIVVAISDPVNTRRIVKLAREINPNIYIVARTRFTGEVPPLLELGADVVIPEEFETSIQIFTRVLKKYLIPENEINEFISEVRSDSYGMFRVSKPGRQSLDDLPFDLNDIEVTPARIRADSPACGKSIAELQIRNSYGVNVVAIQRRENFMQNPDAGTTIHEGDILLLIGKHNDIRNAVEGLAG